VEGDLTIHGVTKKVKSKVTLVMAGGKINANCNFSVRAQDYKIEIPSLVKEKFAEVKAQTEIKPVASVVNEERAARRRARRGGRALLSEARLSPESGVGGQTLGSSQSV
jgi:hypothetical protein